MSQFLPENVFKMEDCFFFLIMQKRNVHCFAVSKVSDFGPYYIHQVQEIISSQITDLTDFFGEFCEFLQ